MTPVVLAVLLAGSVFAAIGQLLFKNGATGSVSLVSFLNPSIVLGLSCYAVSTLAWIWALSRAPLVAVYPFTVLTFVLVYAGSILVFGETLRLAAVLGTALVLAGLFMIVRSVSA